MSENNQNNMSGRFYWHIDREKAKHLYVEIMARGLRNQSYSQIVNDENKSEILKRFPRAWSEFNETERVQKEESLSLLGIAPDLEKELNFLDIKTITDLASLSDIACSNIRRGISLRKKAMNYLKGETDVKTLDQSNDSLSDL